MPLDLEMFLAHTGARFFDHSLFLDNRFSPENRYENEDFIRNRSFSETHALIPIKSIKSKKVELFTEKKIISYQFEQKSNNSEKICNNLIDGVKKKKVSFADDKGFSLVEIREIPGVSTCPSNPLPPLLSDVKQLSIQKRWKIAFECPPWTCSKFVERLENNKVALEFVEIKTYKENKPDKRVSLKSFKEKHNDLNETNIVAFSPDVIEGRIKVKNLGYHKDVFIRITFDRWQSWEDIKANYLKPEKTVSEYDTFSFQVKIPFLSSKFEVIEFCVFYRCNCREYWDNNGGVNYRLVTEVVENKVTPMKCSEKNKICNDRITLSLTENMEKFSEIDSWNNFLRKQPYW